MFRTTSCTLTIKTILPITIACTTLLGGCTNNPIATKPKGATSQFSTRISDSGLKVFRLSAKIQQPLQTRTAIRKPAQSDKPLRRWLEQELAQQLLSSRFCLTGHTEIERSIGTGFALIRGECNELATD